MTIQPGTDIGRYHILEQLGQGGMAVVYKAYDTRLESEVAVKVLRTERLIPEYRERTLKRFHIEAKKMAALQHPNIVGIKDFGEFENVPYLVMEYISSGMLKERCGEPMPAADAVELLKPIADALSYAHSEGLVHRDVKPSNILITKTGQPMLSDFGVAKVLEGEETLDLTVTGMGVGTPEYMAPEQAEGKEIDERADVYSLGVVFYELVTGRKPFEADTPMAVIVKQMHDPLPNPSQYVYELPQEVERVLFKALAKDPADRYQSMAELSKALEKLAIHAAVESPSQPSEEKPNTKLQDAERVVPSIGKTDKTQRPKAFVEELASIKTTFINRNLFLGCLGAIAAIIFFIWLLSLRGPLLTQVLDTITIEKEKNCQIAFVSDRDGKDEIFLMDMDGDNLHQLTNNDTNDGHPVWSPDGSTIAFASYIDSHYLEIYLMDADGGNLRRLTDNDSSDGSPAWSPDGSMIAFNSWRDGDGEIFLMDADGSNQRHLTNNSSYDQRPTWSPDGFTIAFDSSSTIFGNKNIFLIDLDGRNLRQLTDNDNWDPVWSPDGSTIAFVSDRDGDNEIFLMDTDGENLRKLTDNDTSEYCPVWSPDGSMIAFDSWRDGDREIFLMDADGGNLRQLTDNDNDDEALAWSPLCE